MAPTKSVDSLYKLTLSSLRVHIVKCITRHLMHCSSYVHNEEHLARICQDLKFMRYFIFSNVSARATKDLLNEFGAKEVRNVSQCILPMLFSREIVSFSVRSVGCRNFMWCNLSTSHVFNIMKQHGSNVTELCLDDMPCYDAMLFRDAVMNMPHLTCLSINGDYECDDFLEVIGATCHKLKVLEISKFSRVTKDGLERLCFLDYPKNSTRNPCCSTLKVIDIKNHCSSAQRTEITLYSICMVLENLLNLESLGSCSVVGAALILMIKHKRNFSKNIKTITDSGALKTDYIQDLSDHCKNVTQISLISPSEALVENLHLLQDVHELSVCFGHCWTLNKYIKLHGPKLVSLNVELCAGTVNFDKIALFCPNIQTLECSIIEGDIYESMYTFNNLKRLELIRPSVTTSINILKNTPYIQSLTLSSRSLTDNDILDIIDGCQFANLEHLYLFNCRFLTILSMQLFLEAIPNLKYLGYFENFNRENTAVEDFRQMQTMVLERNLAVTLLWSKDSSMPI